MSRKMSIIVMVFAVILLFAASSGAASVTVETGAETPAVLTGKVHHVTARVLLKPGVSVKSRAPIAAALVIDKSGSMQADGKMENAKRGAVEALKMLDAMDIATVVAYDTEAYLLVKARPVSELANFTKSISMLRAGGNTALYDGVRLGAREIERFLESGYVPRIILLSDGLANVGPSSLPELTALGRALSRRGITVTTIGLGLDYDENLMTAIAAESGGNAYFARTKDRLEDIFRRDMEDAVAITGRGVRITISCEGGVRPIRSVGRAGRLNSKELIVDVDNLYSAEKYAIFELEIPASEVEAKLRAGRVKVEYTDAVTGSVVALESYLDIEYTTNESYARKIRNTEIATQADIARNTEVLELAVKLSDSGKGDEASILLRERAEYLSRPEYVDNELIQQQITDFKSLAGDIAREGGMSNESRKSSVNRVYTEKNQQSSWK